MVAHSSSPRIPVISDADSAANAATYGKFSEKTAKCRVVREYRTIRYRTFTFIHRQAAKNARFLKVFLAALAFLAVYFAGLYGRESHDKKVHQGASW
jgi:hypothetical protein